MKKIVDLQKYKSSRDEYKKWKIILKDLKDLEKLLTEIQIKLQKLSKYVPALEILSFINIRKKDVELYRKQYEKTISEYDGSL